MKLREGMQRIVFFSFSLFLSIHIFTCLWIFIATLNKKRSWLSLKLNQIEEAGETVAGDTQTYFISMYYVT